MIPSEYASAAATLGVRPGPAAATGAGEDPGGGGTPAAGVAFKSGVLPGVALQPWAEDPAEGTWFHPSVCGGWFPTFDHAGEDWGCGGDIGAGGCGAEFTGVHAAFATLAAVLACCAGASIGDPHFPQNPAFGDIASPHFPQNAIVNAPFPMVFRTA